MHARTIVAVVAAVTLAATALAANRLPRALGGETCFYEGSTVRGLNQICVYACVSGSAAITISSTAICPLTIQR